MRSKVKRLIIGAFASIVLLTGAVTITAEAQEVIVQPRQVIVYPPYGPFRYPIYEPYYYPSCWVVDPTGYQWSWGYKEGRDEGKDDADDGKPINPARHKDFYKSGSCAYRQAFVQGYYDAYWKKIRD
ncbi:MAG: hypothetical protein ACREAM_28535 [Blastocatellia bacterium]